MNSVCQLDQFHFTKLSAEWRQGDQEEIHIANLSSSFDYNVWRNPKDERQFLMRFWTQFCEETADGERLGNQIEAEVYGRFTLDQSISTDKQDLLIRINGVSILLGIIRGQVASLTGVFPGNKLTIPSFMPQNIVELVEKTKRAQSNADQTRPPRKRTPRKRATKRASKS